MRTASRVPPGLLGPAEWGKPVGFQKAGLGRDRSSVALRKTLKDTYQVCSAGPLCLGWAPAALSGWPGGLSHQVELGRPSGLRGMKQFLPAPQDPSG